MLVPVITTVSAISNEKAWIDPAPDMKVNLSFQGKKQKVIGAGFTFIEILVSVTIIAVLIAIGVASYASVNRRARDAKRKSDLEQIRSSLEQYRADVGSYPDTGASGWFLSSSGPDWIDDLTTVYMDQVPVDPKNTGDSAPAAGDTDPLYVYRSDDTCTITRGREFILGALLETGEEQSTTYGSCTISTQGWFFLGEK